MDAATVKDLIRFLGQFPDNTEIEVICGNGGRGYYPPDSFSRVCMSRDDISVEGLDVSRWVERSCFEYDPGVGGAAGSLLLGRDD